jgi:hypothetical protein
MILQENPIFEFTIPYILEKDSLFYIKIFGYIQKHLRRDM